MFHGAVVQDVMDKDTTHVVCDADDLSRLPALLELDRQLPAVRHFVSVLWVADSIASKAAQEERPYSVRRTPGAAPMADD